MLLRDGERLHIHSALYNWGDFKATMQLMAEQIEETQRRLGYSALQSDVAGG